MLETICYQFGIPDTRRMHVALLYEQAFGDKLALAIPRREARLLLLAESRNLQVAAAIQRGRVLGVASFESMLGGLCREFSFRHLYARLGFMGALRARCVLALLGRTEAPAELLLDGLIVARGARGRGLGRGLLDRIDQIARAQGCSEIRLDVVDRAHHALPDYERLGFEPRRSGWTGLLCRMLGLHSATSFVLRLPR
ncbi:MAG: GNAT family N-acetyltransferase [Rhodocyclaceae bacterium]|nr:GNAT family N-acetyltransferase [Rhodocyclaceae bacterium]